MLKTHEGFAYITPTFLASASEVRTKSCPLSYSSTKSALLNCWNRPSWSSFLHRTMSYPPNNRMPLPGPPLGQQSMGPSRGIQYAMKHPEFSGHQPHLSPPDSTFNEQLAFFSMHKPTKTKSWDDITPVRHRLSTSEIRKALSKLQQRPKHSVKDTLMNLESNSARRVINALVQEQNDQLVQVDPTSEWIIAGLDVQRETVKYLMGQTRIPKNISVILKTEPSSSSRYEFDDDLLSPSPPAGFLNTGRNQMSHMHQHGPQHHDNAIMHNEPRMMQPPHQAQDQPQFHGHDRGRGHGMMPGREEPPHMILNGQHGPVQEPFPQGGANRGGYPQGDVPLGHNPHADPHMNQHVGQQPHPPMHPRDHHHEGGPQGMIIPPPPPVGMPGVVHQPQGPPPPFEPHQQPGPMPGSFPDPNSMGGPVQAPQFAPPVEVVNPHVLNHQRSKPTSLRREFKEFQEHEYEFESGKSDSDSQYSLRSAEDGGYSVIERSRSRGRKRSKTRTRSRSRSADRSRSSDRVRVQKVYKSKNSHGRTRSIIENVHEERYKTSSKDGSPRPPVAAIPTQPIINIRIDNDNDRERDRTGDRIKEVYTPDHDSRRTGRGTPSPTFSHAIFSKHDKFDSHIPSRHSSIGGSDTDSSVIDGASSTYTSDDSVFSEPTRPSPYDRMAAEVGTGGPHLRSRNISIPHNDTLVSAYHNSRRRQKQRFSVDDYPPAPRRGSLHEDHIEPHRAPFYQRPPMAPRHHSGQAANHFEPRYPPQPSRSYTDVPPPPSYKPQLPPQLPPQRYITEDRPDAFELRAMADQLDAMDYINQTRRSGLSTWRGNMRARAGAEVDEWAYHPSERVFSGYRHV